MADQSPSPRSVRFKNLFFGFRINELRASTVGLQNRTASALTLSLALLGSLLYFTELVRTYASWWHQAVRGHAPKLPPGAPRFLSTDGCSPTLSAVLVSIEWSFPLLLSGPLSGAADFNRRRHDRVEGSATTSTKRRMSNLRPRTRSGRSM